MSARMLAFGGLVVAGVVLALVVALRPGEVPERADGGAAPGPASAGAAGEDATVGRRAAGSPTRAPAPRLPAAAPDEPVAARGADAPLWTAYDDEQRDPSWATAREQEIRARLRPLLEEANRAAPDSVRVPQIECREEHCRLMITGEVQARFQSFVEALQDERGFYGDAALLALDGYGETVDERTGRTRYEVRVHLRYAR